MNFLYERDFDYMYALFQIIIRNRKFTFMTEIRFKPGTALDKQERDILLSLYFKYIIPAWLNLSEKS